MNYIRYVIAKGLHRTSLEIALDLIYAATELEFPGDKIIFGVPQAIDVRLDTDTDPNTYVPVKYVAEGFDYRYHPKGDEGLLYSRIPLTLLTPLENLTFVEPSSFVFSTHSILTQINTKLNTQLTTSDVLDVVYEGSTDYITLEADPKSLVWLGKLVLWFDGKEPTAEGRITEDEDLRITEDGNVRALESSIQ